MLDLNHYPVFLVMAIAVIAPLLAEIPVGFRLPVVVLEMVLGIVAGPHVLGLVETGGTLGYLGSSLGLGALFFMAGMELDLKRVRGRPLSLAVGGWLLSLVLGVAAASLLHVIPFVRAPIMVAAALTTTAIGTLMPILRDSGELETGFGRLILAAGAMGEFGPIVVVSLALTPGDGLWIQVGAMLAVLSKVLGVEAILGAFAAGIILGMATRGERGEPMREKIDAVCFGFMVPFFFVSSGVNLDVGGILQSVKTMLLIPLFLALFFVVRGAPVLIYGNSLARGEQLPFALYASTALPMVLAITTIGVETGRMPNDIAGALVGAGILSVLLFPAIAGALRARQTKLMAIEDAGEELR